MFKPPIAVLAFGLIASATNYKRVLCPDGKNTATNVACCVFFELRDDLQENLFGSECGDVGYQLLRMSWQDSIGFSTSGAFAGGGADGSIVIFSDIELNYFDNIGLDDAVNSLKPFLQRYDVTAGDLVQFAAAVGISNCAGVPQLQFLAGRPNATVPAIEGSGVLATDSVDLILNRIADVGLSPEELVACLAAHSIGRADNVIPGMTDVPFDTTPSAFDTQFFLETLLAPVGFPFGINGTAEGEAESPLPASGELRLQSDFGLARDPRTACTWQSMINNQELMMLSFQAAMAKVAIIGHELATLVDCSEVIPVPALPVGKPASFPAGTGPQDIQQGCSSPFPVLSTDPGPPTIIP